jgi:hypothetical protein
MSGKTDQDQASYDLDERFDALARSISALLQELGSAALAANAQTAKARRRIVHDLGGVLEDSSWAGNEERLMQRIIGGVDVEAEKSGAVALKRPGVSVEKGCVGRKGGGVVADFGPVAVKMCVIGSLDDGIKGGGVEITFKC